MGRKKQLHRVFVYGTLRPSEVVTHTLAGYAMFRVPGKTFSFPFIQPLEGFVVAGNVIEVDATGLSDLDRYEGVDRGLYKRVKVQVLDSQSNTEEAWVYVAGPALAYPLIQSGDWFNR